MKKNIVRDKEGHYIYIIGEKNRYFIRKMYNSDFMFT